MILLEQGQNWWARQKSSLLGLLGKSTFTKSDKKMLWVWKIERKIEKEEKIKEEKKGNIVVNGLRLTMLPYKQKKFFFNARGNIFNKMPSGTLSPSK